MFELFTEAGEGLFQRIAIIFQCASFSFSWFPICGCCWIISSFPGGTLNINFRVDGFGRSSVASCEPSSQQDPEMLKMNFQMFPESTSTTLAQKCWKWASRGVLRAIWQPGARNAYEHREPSWEPISVPSLSDNCQSTLRHEQSRTKPIGRMLSQ